MTDMKELCFMSPVFSRDSFSTPCGETAHMQTERLRLPEAIQALIRDTEETNSFTSQLPSKVIKAKFLETKILQVFSQRVTNRPFPRDVIGEHLSKSVLS